MSHLMQDIVVFFDDSKTGQKTVEAAARLAAEQKANLIGIATTEYADAKPADGFARGKAIAEVSRRLEASAETHSLVASQMLAEAANRYGIAAQFRVISHPGTDDEMALESLYCDLLVATPGTPFAWSPTITLQQASIPILIVPHAWDGLTIGRRITVAWNASRQARRAVADALPLLIAAETVDLLIVDPEPKGSERGEDSGADMAAYLSRHGVRVELQRVFSQGRSVAEAIVANAVERNADLIVFGAYSRPWISEAVLGGVSRTLLAQVSLPLFVSR